MEYSKYSEIEILTSLKRVDDGLPVQMLCSELGISLSTYKAWLMWRDEAKLKAMAHRETQLLMERLKALEAENVRLKQLQPEEYQKSNRLRDGSEKT